MPKFRDVTKVDIRYPLLEPFAYARIKWNPVEKKLVYTVIEPELKKSEKSTLEKVSKLLTEMIDAKITVMDRNKAIQYLHDKMAAVMDEANLKIPLETYVKIMYFMIRNFVGLDEIEPLLHDPYLEDVGCSGIGTPVYVVHRRFGSIETGVVYNDPEYLNNFVIKLSERCGKYISYAKPLLGGTLPDGSRIQASLSKDVTTKGPTFSIRKFRKNPFSPTDLISLKTSDPQTLAYLWFMVEHAASMMVCGGVATGKTTFLNALSMFIPQEKKIISIEDVREINIPHPNWIPATERIGFGIPEIGGKRYGEVTMFDLLKESFRMKPDYTIVGEIRGEESYVLFQGMASGSPAMGTMHAGSVEDMIKRLQTPPIELSPSLIEALDIVVVMTNAEEKGKSARRVKEIVEIESVDMETGKFNGVKTFRWMPANDSFKNDSAKSPMLSRISTDRGLSFPRIREDIRDRTKVLEWMKKFSIVQFEDVCAVIDLYYKDKPNVMRWVERGTPPKKMIRKATDLWESATGLKEVK
jgi:flagellar protein FlaI